MVVIIDRQSVNQEILIQKCCTIKLSKYSDCKKKLYNQFSISGVLSSFLCLKPSAKFADFSFYILTKIAGLEYSF